MQGRLFRQGISDNINQLKGQKKSHAIYHYSITPFFSSNIFIFLALFITLRCKVKREFFNTNDSINIFICQTTLTP